MPAIPGSAAWFAMGRLAYIPSLNVQSPPPPQNNYLFSIPDNDLAYHLFRTHLYASRNNGRWLSFIGNAAYDIDSATLLTPPVAVSIPGAGYFFTQWYPTDINANGRLEYPVVQGNLRTFSLLEIGHGPILTHDFNFNGDRQPGYYIGHAPNRIIPVFPSFAASIDYPPVSSTYVHLN